MTPRNVKDKSNHDLFAQQPASERAACRSSKKFKSYAVKGSKLAAGYHDRAGDRGGEDDEEDARESRIQALKEQMKLGQLDEKTFEQLRDQITDGDISATHLVKGLDWKLLQRVRDGEDVLRTDSAADKDAEREAHKRHDDAEDEEQVLEEIEKAEVTPVPRMPSEKKGQLALKPPNKPVAGVKRSRAEILEEMRARKATVEPDSGGAIRKIGANVLPEKGTSKIERDKYGREVLITVDEEGNVKRKIRKANPGQRIGDKLEKEDSGRKSQRSGPALGSDVNVPIVEMADETGEEDDDIFHGIGHEYDPLANLDDGEAEGTSSLAKEHDATLGESVNEGHPPMHGHDKTSTPPTAEPAKANMRPTRDYFATPSAKRSAPNAA